MWSLTRCSLAAVALLSFGACAPSATAMSHGARATGDPSLATVIRPLGGSGVTGRLTFVLDGSGVRIEGVVQGLAPGSRHGFHVHEIGDCSDPQGKSAGGHFNPTHHSHGDLTQNDSHLGDLGNILADATGTATINLLKPEATLAEGPNAYLGRSVIVHQDPDDLTTQPTGKSGARIACGVIVNRVGSLGN